LLQVDIYLLLEMPLRLQYLPGVHAGKHVGDVMQRHYLDMSGLWWTERLWKPVKMIFYPEEKNHVGQNYFH
jgi:hypothetical protein